ncbi:hypothetical protein O0L34_g10298 [Tuta absoluta]|nr:hypothetical protein O0L34_g10298 [Tuta absoluta]
MYVTTLLEKIVHGDYDFCGICYKRLTDERTSLGDEVMLQENDLQKSLKISEILSYVLGEDVFTDMSVFQSLCSPCAASAVNSYKFIKEAKENVTYISNAVENLSSCFHQSEIPDLNQCDSLFLTLNPKDLCIGLQFYNNIGLIQSKTEAFEKYLAANVKQKIVPTQKASKPRNEQFEQSRKRPWSRNDFISTVDMVHNGDMSSLVCKECLKEFQSVSNMRLHFLRLHAPKQFKCPECPKSFGAKGFLRAHLADGHNNMICSECGKSFNSLQSFKTHEKTHNVRIVCPDCGRVYKNQTTYRKHIENNVCQTKVRHSPADAKFTCDYCNKKYTQKISLRVHIQYEHLNYKHHECKWCKKKFWCQARLKAHIVKHTREKNFICTICSGKFVTKESLLYHTRIHTGEKPYPCPFCDNRFLSASRRQAHLKSHHMDPTLECDVCKSKFKTVVQLMKHKYIHEQHTENVSTDDGELELWKSGLKYPKAEKSLTSRIEIQEQKIIYNVIEGDVCLDNVYQMQSDSNENQQETVYLEMTEDGEYSVKLENIK